MPVYTNRNPIKPVSEILDEAAELVSTGWCQDRGFIELSDRTFHCAASAISEAAGDTGSEAIPAEVEEGFTLACDYISLTLGYEVLLTEWNDNPARTQAEVVATLRVAADRARAAEQSGTRGLLSATPQAAIH